MDGIKVMSSDATINETVTLTAKITVSVKDLTAKDGQTYQMSKRSFVEALSGKTAEQVLQEARQKNI